MARPSKKISNKKSEQKFQKPSKKSFKPTRKTDETQVLAMQLQDDVPDFPRATARGGGRSSLGKEVDEVDGDDVDMEFESGERELNNNNYKNKNKRLQKRNHSAEEDDLGSLFGDGISGKLPSETAPYWVNVLTIKTSVSLNSVSLSQSLPQLSFPLFQNPRFEALTRSRSVSNTHSLARSLNFSSSTLDLLDCRSKTLDGLHLIDLCRSQSNSLAILHRSLSLEGFALAVLHRTRTRSVLHQIDLFCSSSNRRSKIQNPKSICSN
ncbi:hypothetical protein TEA_021433 [Camellia sinensis var. sinensis]|uniref:Uncharacterized protein n=1 Tax=Camellia sinensis var. sinensis TaxID=542762 RepID=A0A4S4EW38_CAMSN|nr:hypothetical protein TEA_021433 [Camellia sinensis var. sinensis]